jgi:hypothetical protein
MHSTFQKQKKNGFVFIPQILQNPKKNELEPNPPPPNTLFFIKRERERTCTQPLAPSQNKNKNEDWGKT